MKKSLLRLLVLLAIVALGVALLVFLPIPEYLTRFVEWTQSLGPWGPVAVAVAYVPATVLGIPGTILSLGAGYAFGVVTGTIAVSIGSTAGASAAFWVGRTLARGWVERRVAAHARFRAIDQAVAEHGFKIVLLTRLSPVFPFTFLNYAFGLTRVRFRDYLLASWLGMLPGTVMYLYLGSTLKELSDLASGKVEGGVGQRVFFFAGLAATVVVTGYVTRLARKALRQAVPELDRGSGAQEQGANDAPDAAGAAAGRP
jgi:uncharacterized membrane protein YdjX (TVP38/TMEM64 family)